MRAISLFSAVALLSIAAQAYAIPLTVVNPGFEEPYRGGNLPVQYDGNVPATAFPVGDAPDGWAAFGAVGGSEYIGVLNPGVMAVEPMATYFPAGAPEGDNVALTFFDGFQGGAEFGIQQTLSATLQANTRYSLSVEVGNIASGVSVVQPYAGFGFFDLRGFPGYRIDLLAGGTVIAQDNNSVLPDEGEFELATLAAVIGESHPQLGQPLQIRLVNLNDQDVNDPAIDLEVDFDDVRLDATPLAAADFDHDGKVDGTDLATWEAAYSATSGADADDDGDTDGADFLMWQQQFTGTNVLRAVPEPSAAALAFCWGLFGLRVRRSPRLLA